MPRNGGSFGSRFAVDLSTEPVTVTRLGRTGKRRDYFGVLAEIPGPGGRMRLYLAPTGTMVTTEVVRVFAAADGWTLYVQTENSLYAVRGMVLEADRPT